MVTIQKHGWDAAGHTIEAIYVKDEQNQIIAGRLCTTREACGAQFPNGYELELEVTPDLKADSLTPYAA
jgi:hypothetical protein